MARGLNGGTGDKSASAALEEAYEKAEAGLPQLVIAVAGIYGSL